MSPAQLRKVSEQHAKLERELEEAEERAVAEQQRVLRLRKQKKLWFEKMMKAISRGIDSVEELERVEREEAEKEQRRMEQARPPSNSSERLPSDFASEWDAVYGDVPLSPSVLDLLGVVDGNDRPVVGSSSN